MQDAERNLKRTAVDFLEAAETAARAAREADPLDAVGTDLFDLDAFEPALDADELARLKRRIRTERVLPEALAELVALARQVAGVLGGV